jgi:hypothetical protein
VVSSRCSLTLDAGAEEDKPPPPLKAMIVVMPSLLDPNPLMLFGLVVGMTPLSEGVDLMPEATLATPDFVA